MYRIFLKHLRSGISNLQLGFDDFDRSTRDCYSHFNLKQLHEALKSRRPDNSSKDKSKSGKGRKKLADHNDATDIASANTAANVNTPAMAAILMDLCSLLKKCDIDIDRFDRDLYGHASTKMGTTIINLSDRQHGTYIDRILATSGLRWNVHSNFKSRDFAQVALAACLENLIVPKYRCEYMQISPGATHLRDDIRHAFSRMLKPMEPQVVQSEQSSVSPPDQMIITTAMAELPLAPEPDPELLDWDFADRIDNSSKYQSKSPRPNHNCSDLQRDLDRSAKLKEIRDDNSLKRLLEPILNCPYIACSEPGVPPGTIETSAHRFLCLILSVSDSFIPTFSPPAFRFSSLSLQLTNTHPVQIMTYNQTRMEHEMRPETQYDLTTGNIFNVLIDEVINRPHAESQMYDHFVSRKIVTPSHRSSHLSLIIRSIQMRIENLNNLVDTSSNIDLSEIDSELESASPSRASSSFAVSVGNPSLAKAFPRDVTELEEQMSSLMSDRGSPAPKHVPSLAPTPTTSPLRVSPPAGPALQMRSQAINRGSPAPKLYIPSSTPTRVPHVAPSSSPFARVTPVAPAVSQPIIISSAAPHISPSNNLFLLPTQQKNRLTSLTALDSYSTSDSQSDEDDNDGDSGECEGNGDEKCQYMAGDRDPTQEQQPFVTRDPVPTQEESVDYDAYNASFGAHLPLPYIFTLGLNAHQTSLWTLMFLVMSPKQWRPCLRATLNLVGLISFLPSCSSKLTIYEPFCRLWKAS